MSIIALGIEFSEGEILELCTKEAKRRIKKERNTYTKEKIWHAVKHGRITSKLLLAAAKFGIDHEVQEYTHEQWRLRMFTNVRVQMVQNKKRIDKIRSLALIGKAYPNTWPFISFVRSLPNYIEFLERLRDYKNNSNAERAELTEYIRTLMYLSPQT